jgi:hypothetical protein
MVNLVTLKLLVYRKAKQMKVITYKEHKHLEI